MVFAQFFLVISYVVCFSLTAYLAGNAKSHVKPYRFFIAALITIMIGYGFKVINESKNASLEGLEKAIPAVVDNVRYATGHVDHIAELLQLASGAFAGALASAAIQIGQDRNTMPKSSIKCSCISTISRRGLCTFRKTFSVNWRLGTQK
ncbi:hypothetical protein [Massilia timonae]|uniref:hypothetical protein n=1 Tax=Massilia timonae TaxID=47229 RepID=UPI0028CFEC92|nr:hypothetical protein [Massilia timonae]